MSGAKVGGAARATALVILLWGGVVCAARPWRAAAPPDRIRTWAPPGGTVYGLAADPFHAGWVELGTTTGAVYRSTDAGAHWRFLAFVTPHADWVVATLIADPTREGVWYAALWSWSEPAGSGGVAVSDDGGAHWRLLFAGHAVRALAQAASDPAVLVAAAHDGVYRSADAGAHWQRISPLSNRELTNLESVAIDPTNPAEVYVGTWHLPWKTFDGGRDWLQIGNGMIDDSDVFAIAIDRLHPATVYLSACSGIYRSDSSGVQFRKLQGIPYSARRTTALVQDAGDPRLLFAGTTQGLWISRDAGADWVLVTAPGIGVNAVLPLGHGRVLLGTEFAGVMLSTDDAASFSLSNDGFVNRHVAAVATGGDSVYEAVTGDEAWGGVFESSDGGADWSRLPALPGADPQSLWYAAGGLLAGSADGIFQLDGNVWRRRAGGRYAPVYQFAGGAVQAPVFAAAAGGLLRSDDGGRDWTLMPAAPKPLFGALENGGRLCIAGGAGERGFVLCSGDAGAHFDAGALYLEGRVSRLAVQPASGAAGATVFAATSRGLYRSPDGGATWQLAGHGIGAQPIAAVYLEDGEVIAEGTAVGAAFRSRDRGLSWQPFTPTPAQEDWSRGIAALLPTMPAATAFAPAPQPQNRIAAPPAVPPQSGVGVPPAPAVPPSEGGHSGQ